MSQVNNYRLRCITENINVTCWGVTAPTVCPNNNTHSINVNSVVIINSINETNVNVIDEVPPENEEYTKGRFRCNGLECSISTENYTIKHFGWVYPICALEIIFYTLNENVGDYIDLHVIPTTHIGNTSNSIEIGATVIPLTDECFTIASVDMQIFIMDNINTFFLGCIISKNSETKTITITNASDKRFNKNSYITYRSYVGVITQNITSSDNLINVNSTVTDKMKQGQCLTIMNNVTNDNLGEIFEIDQDNLTVLIQSPSSINYNAGSKLYPSAHIIKNYKINSISKHNIGGSSIGGSYVTKFYIIKLVYKNTSNLVKNFNWYVEYKY